MTEQQWKKENIRIIINNLQNPRPAAEWYLSANVVFPLLVLIFSCLLLDLLPFPLLSLLIFPPPRLFILFFQWPPHVLSIGPRKTFIRPNERITLNLYGRSSVGFRVSRNFSWMPPYIMPPPPRRQFYGCGIVADKPTRSRRCKSALSLRDRAGPLNIYCEKFFKEPELLMRHAIR